ncbi:Abi family protein [Propioniciclava sp.]|uniref:Abi family protein n=1 Tax=Propioniciclava sp. TaxID=2038686 RepID=UPI002D1FC1C3|nr:Abi family protein [Propioniciclava sp.]
MVDYAKPWLPVDAQIDKLIARGVVIADRAGAAKLLRTVGYYRLTGYLYPFRTSERYTDEHDRERTRVLNRYREGTSIEDAARLLDFDRQLRLLVLDGVERIEIALRTQIGHTVGRVGPFAHQDTSTFGSAFTEPHTDATTGLTSLSRLDRWLARVQERRDSSKEAFVAHFRAKYDDQMPIWALIELLELGHLSRLYAGLRNDLATEIATAFDVPTKRLMESWIATINYVRNIAAHHARLFNRKLVTAPKRPKAGQVPLLAHLSESDAPKQFGSYNALAVMANLLRTIDPGGDWALRVATLLRAFPKNAVLDLGSMGVAPGWLDEDLWHI